MGLVLGDKEKDVSMEQEPVAGIAGEAMAFGLINQANVLSKSARETQQAWSTRSRSSRT